MRYIPAKNKYTRSKEINTPPLRRFSRLTICLHKFIKFAIINHFLDNIEHDGNGAQRAHDAADTQRVGNGLAQPMGAFRGGPHRWW